MKPKSLVSSLGALTFLLRLTPTCDARPHHSHHHHGGHRASITKGLGASSGNSFIAETSTAISGYADERSSGASIDASHIVEHRSLTSSAHVQNSRETSVFLSFSTPDAHKTHLSDNNDMTFKQARASASQATTSHDLSTATQSSITPLENSIQNGLAEKSESIMDLSYEEVSGPIHTQIMSGVATLELRHLVSKGHHRWTCGKANIGRFHQSASTNSATGTTVTGVCPLRNGTTFKSHQSKTYQVLCDIDFLNNDYPFRLVDSFDSCVQACDEINAKSSSNQCLAALFVPSRLTDSDNCYLKYSVNSPTAATIPIEGAIWLESTNPLPTPISPSANIIPSSMHYSTPSSLPGVSGSMITYADGNSIVVPKTLASQLHGPSQNKPSQQFLAVKAPKTPRLSDDLLVVGVNSDLTTNYSISPDTGYLKVNSSTQSLLTPLKNTPRLSRDGGQGGYLDGQHLFVFSDTGSYSANNGDMLGFVSSSLAVDVGMNGLYGKPLDLQDGIGAWSDNVGRMRGLAPLTEGEQSYNIVMQGKGQRYAVWPESSLIPLDAKTSLVFAPIVYDNVNRVMKTTVFTYAGATLLSVTSGGEGGPVAVRTVEKLFNQDEVEWGCAGGIRSWGPSGIGGTDGKVYVFGNVQDGILLARTSPGSVTDRNSYEYWDGQSWSSQMLDSSSDAFFITGDPYMDIDIFYSPRHLTFIAVYLNHYADSTFYYRYLMADSAIFPPYTPNGNKDEDIVENLVKYNWSDEFVLYKAAPGINGDFIYAGGVHQQYYGPDDITNGGSKMLLSWTAPTGQDASTLVSEYQIVTAEIHWA